MYTYQDLLQVGDDERKRIMFVKSAISSHRNSTEYEIAKEAQEYAAKRNTTIIKFQKLLYTVTGKVVPDNFSANYKLCSGFFNLFTTQQTQFLLGNGVSWEHEDTEEKLSVKKYKFDTVLQKIAKAAIIEGVAFGFWNHDHIECFKLTEFVPLFDEEDGSLKAGIRFWQIDTDKPLRATLYEIDGRTEIIYRAGEDYEILSPKTGYNLYFGQSAIDGLEIYAATNYPTFPIVPLWANEYHQSELVGLQEQIDCYDLIKSGFANTVDEASYFYWVIQNAGGMDEEDLVKFVERIKVVHAATVEDDGAQAEAHTMDVPYASREALLDRLEEDLYRDYMALNPKIISGGAVTATQIKAAYEPVNNKADGFEFFVQEFIYAILELAEIEDQPSFTRSMIINTTENIQAVLQAAQYLTDDYVTQKVLEYLDDGDKILEMLKQMDEESMERFTQNVPTDEGDEGQWTTDTNTQTNN